MEAGGFLNSRLSWCTLQVTGLPGLYSESLFQKTKRIGLNLALVLLSVIHVIKVALALFY